MDRVWSRTYRGVWQATSPWRLLAALLSVIAIAGLMLPFRESLGVLNVLLIFLILTLLLALRLGLWPAVAGAVAGFLAFDFLFIPPYGTFSVADPDHTLAIVVYLLVAVITARLAAGLQLRSAEALRESRRSSMLAELNAALIGDVTLDAILNRIVERVVTVYGAQGCRVIIADAAGELVVGAVYPPTLDPRLDGDGRALAGWVWAHRQTAGYGQRSGQPSRRLHGQRGPARRVRTDVVYLPIKTATRVAGVLEVIGRPGSVAARQDDELVLTTFADQAALAFERARLSEESARAAAIMASDELKSALLAAVSHDLRTPLASIKAAASSLLDDSVSWEPATERELLTAIDEEADRLTLVVSNLLDLSRIEGGALRPAKDWYDVDEVIVDVRNRLAARLEPRPVTLDLEPDLPSLPFDYVQIAQVLTNLLENAIRYTPAGTPITVTARRAGNMVELAVHDSGPGIPADQQGRLFEKFYRVNSSPHAAGTGIGLAICRGLVEAHGGRIWVESDAAHGTTFRFTLPLASPPTLPPAPADLPDVGAARELSAPAAAP